MMFVFLGGFKVFGIKECDHEKGILLISEKVQNSEIIPWIINPTCSLLMCGWHLK
jgi:hypothetical protein